MDFYLLVVYSISTLFFCGGKAKTVVLASRSSSVKLALVSCVFVGGGSGPSGDGSAIVPGLAPARHAATTVLYQYIINHHVLAVFSLDTVAQGSICFRVIQSIWVVSGGVRLDNSGAQMTLTSGHIRVDNEIGRALSSRSSSSVHLH